MKVSIVGSPQPDRVLKNMVLGIDGIAQQPKGSRIVYHIGNYDDMIGLKPVGRMASNLEKMGSVILVQKTISESMSDGGPVRTFEYMAVMR